MPLNQYQYNPLNGANIFGGEAGIRTLGRFNPSPVFKTGAFDHSATSPEICMVKSRTRILLKFDHVSMQQHDNVKNRIVVDNIYNLRLGIGQRSLLLKNNG